MIRLFENDEIESFDSLLPRIKAGLMTHNREIQVSNVQLMLQHLTENSEDQRESKAAKFIKFDIVSCLCEILKTAKGNLLTITFDCLALMVNYHAFYDSRTVINVTRTTINSAQSAMVLQENLQQKLEDEPVLQATVKLIYNILSTSTSKFGLDLDRVCDSQQVLHFCKQINSFIKSLYFLRFEIAAILTVLLSKVTFESLEERETVYNTSSNVIGSMKLIIAENDEDDSIVCAIAVLCQISVHCVGYCQVETEENFTDDQNIANLRIRKAFVNLIYNTIMDTIIPHVKTLKLIRAKEKWYGCVISCFNSLYALREFNQTDLSNHLTVNGYLKYFLELTTFLQEKYQRKVCVLLTRILSNLVETSERFSINDWPGGMKNFSGTLFNGFYSLPRKSEEWSKIIGSSSTGSMALLLLFYYHYCGTRDKYLISLDCIIARILKLSITSTNQIVVLKLLWFSLAVTSLSESEAEKIKNYDVAVERLVAALLSSNLFECYSHHISLLQFSLESSLIPRDLQRQVVDFWLIESEGNVKPLFKLGSEKAMKLCLSAIVKSNYPEHYLSMPVKAILDLKSLENAKEISRIVWEMLPEFFASHATTCRLSAILELAGLGKPDFLSDSALKISSDDLISVISKNNSNPALKSLAMDELCEVFYASRARKFFDKALEKYINEHNLPQSLWANGFVEKETKLSISSINLLAHVSHMQRETLVKCEKPVTLQLRHLYELIWTRRKSESCIRALHLLYEALSTAYKNGYCIGLAQIINKNGFMAIRDLFSGLHVVQQLDPLLRTDAVCLCISSLFQFCQRNSWFSLLDDLLAHPLNDYMIERTLEGNLLSPIALDFVIVWLRLKRDYNDDRTTAIPNFDLSLKLLRCHAEKLLENSETEAFGQLDVALKAYERERQVDDQNANARNS